MLGREGHAGLLWQTLRAFGPKTLTNRDLMLASWTVRFTRVEKDSIILTTENTGPEGQDSAMSTTSEIIGPTRDETADAVGHPLNEQVREYIRASKAEN